MYSLLIDTLIWTFAIYGVISFMQEYILDITCYIIKKCININKLLKKRVHKKVK